MKYSCLYLVLIVLFSSCQSPVEKKTHTDSKEDSLHSPSENPEKNIERAVREIGAANEVTEKETPQHPPVSPPVVPPSSQVSSPKAPSVVAKISSPKNITVASDKDYLLGKFDFTKHPDFVAVESPYTQKPKGEVYLRKETFAAFQQMFEAAAKDGIKLTILSGTRNFDRQKQIWEGKWKARAKQFKSDKDLAENILKFSSMPSTSRHHWGTDIDLNDLNDASFTKGEGKKVYDWLIAHAAEYGFCNVYSAGRQTGYHEEKWHWSYLPVASGLIQQYAATIQLADITGFEGADTKTDLDVIKNYVLGINPLCK